MVLDSLGDSLRNALQKITKIGLVDKAAVIELSAEIKRALIAGDVNIKLAKEISQKIRDRALKEKPAGALTAREHTINIVFEELTNFLGKEQGKINLEKKPLVMLLVGLFGSGKTTTCGKLAKYFKKQGKRVALVQTDTWRPAAYAQLKQLAEAVKVDFYGDENERNPVKILKGVKDKFEKYDIVIVDSAGRDALNQELITEIKAVNANLNPDEVLLVLSGDIGQAAENQAQSFHNSCGVTGVIITKLDGTAKGGGAISACAVTDASVKFIGVGEKLDAFEEFKPKNFVSRLLGMGDLETLLKKAESAIDKEKAEQVAKKVTSGKSMSLQDLYDQMEALQKMGPLSQVMNMIPGMAGMNLPKEMLKGQEKSMKGWKYLMDSMTQDEKDNPEIIHSSRIKRISEGSGRSEKEVRALLKQWKMMGKMTKKMGSGRQMKQLEKMMKSGGMKALKMPGM